MKKWTTTNGYEIYLFSTGFSNTYLVRFRGKSILTDTSLKANYSKLKKELARAGLQISQTDYLFLTHTHYDHCQNAAQIKKQSGCKVIVSENAATYIKKGDSPLPKGTNSYSKIVIGLGDVFGKFMNHFEPFEADIFVKDERQTIEGFPEIEIRQTPGHSPDSISLIVDGEYALVGDTAFGIFKNSAFPPFANDIPQLYRSWGRLLSSSCKFYLPGHGKPVTRKKLEEEWKAKAKS